MLKILIADDHEIVRRGLKQILFANFSPAHIEEAGDTNTLITKAINDKWDIIISDISMPGGGGISALKIIKEKMPDIPFLFFSAHPEEQYAARVIKAGADGYINKDADIEDLIKVIGILLAGKKYISDEIAATLSSSSSELKNTSPHEFLSERELNIFTMLASGKSVIEIASKLSLAPTTVSTYRYRILTKMDMKTNAELTRYALEHSFI